MTAAPQLPGMPPEDAATRVARGCWAAILAARAGNPAYKLTEDALEACLRPALAKELPKKARAVNGRNPLFDAIAAGFGHGAGYNGKITRAAAATIGKALAEIREVDPTVTAEDLERGCRYVRKKYENAGPMALSAHWDECATHRTERTRTQRTDIYREPPTGWREVARKRYPDSADWANPCNFSTVAWLDVSPLLRPEILKLIP